MSGYGFPATKQTDGVRVQDRINPSVPFLVVHGQGLRVVRFQLIIAYKAISLL